MLMKLRKLEIKKTVQASQLVRKLSKYTKAVGLVLGQGTYNNQLISASVSGTTNPCVCVCVCVPLPFLSVSKINT